MTFYEVYKSYPFGVAGLMENYASCKLCTAKKCEQCDRNKTGYEECFRNWEEYLGKKPDKLDSLYSMAEFLCQAITCCEKCPVEEENKCNGSCNDSFRLWMNSEINQKPENEGMQGVKAEDVKAVKRILEEHDAVHHPNHCKLVDGIEVIDVIRVILNRSNFTGIQGYYLGNVLKYVLRADQKNGEEDYKKAAVYLEWLIQGMEEEND